MLGGATPTPLPHRFGRSQFTRMQGGPRRALAQEPVEVHVAPSTAPPLASHRVSLQTLALSRGAHRAKRPSLCFVTPNLNLEPQNLSSRFVLHHGGVSTGLSCLLRGKRLNLGPQQAPELPPVLPVTASTKSPADGASKDIRQHSGTECADARALVHGI